ncbi:MAG TPA: LytTR family DNA-binding domain-containing protein [Chitinophagaceae bacterium]|nr:LytTR family DNA-binding domain-containing protein [Chitinophagaceae bacterium]
MKFDSCNQHSFTKDNIYSKKSICIAAGDLSENRMEFMRFEEKKDHFIWAHADELCFVKSADHYIKALIQCGDHFKWMTRHSTLKELLDILPAEHFIRLNKFYLLNLDHFMRISIQEKIIFLKNDFAIPVPHRISPFLLHLLKTANT